MIRSAAALLVLTWGAPALAQAPAGTPPAGAETPKAATPTAGAPAGDAKAAPASDAKAAPASDAKAAPASDAKAAPASDSTAAPAASSAPAAGNAPGTPETPAWEKEPPTRRAGFTVGFALGGGIGNIRGYPSDLEKREDVKYRADLGAALGGGGSLWLGGALTDWLVFGAGLGAGSYQGNGIIVEGLTFALHTEVFPLFWLGGVWREMGIALDTGAGSFTGELQDKPAGPAGKLVAPVIESGAASRVGIGVFYDGLRFWKASAGPFVALDYTWSSTLSQPMVLVGLRTALYVKAPKPKK